MTASRLTVNGTDYRWPDRPMVAVCNDGGDPACIEHGVTAGIIPTIERCRPAQRLGGEAPGPRPGSPTAGAT